jgi:predicted Zn-ribbon and HTH transcriptional regulator
MAEFFTRREPTFEEILESLQNPEKYCFLLEGEKFLVLNADEAEWLSAHPERCEKCGHLELFHDDLIGHCCLIPACKCRRPPIHFSFPCAMIDDRTSGRHE